MEVKIYDANAVKPIVPNVIQSARIVSNAIATQTDATAKWQQMVIWIPTNGSTSFHVEWSEYRNANCSFMAYTTDTEPAIGVSVSNYQNIGSASKDITISSATYLVIFMYDNRRNSTTPIWNNATYSITDPNGPLGMWKNANLNLKGDQSIQGTPNMGNGWYITIPSSNVIMAKTTSNPYQYGVITFPAEYGTHTYKLVYELPDANTFVNFTGDYTVPCVYVACGSLPLVQNQTLTVMSNVSTISTGPLTRETTFTLSAGNLQGIIIDKQSSYQTPINPKLYVQTSTGWALINLHERVNGNWD